MTSKLLDFGFSEEQAAQLLKGKTINVFYGKVKYNKSSQELTTVYHAGGAKKVVKLQEGKQ